jgi:hypothetical protein
VRHGGEENKHNEHIRVSTKHCTILLGILHTPPVRRSVSSRTFAQVSKFWHSAVRERRSAQLPSPQSHQNPTFLSSRHSTRTVRKIALTMNGPHPHRLELYDTATPPRPPLHIKRTYLSTPTSHRATRYICTAWILGTFLLSYFFWLASGSLECSDTRVGVLLGAGMLVVNGILILIF